MVKYPNTAKERLRQAARLKQMELIVQSRRVKTVTGEIDYVTLIYIHDKVEQERHRTGFLYGNVGTSAIVDDRIVYKWTIVNIEKALEIFYGRQ